MTGSGISFNQREEFWGWHFSRRLELFGSGIKTFLRLGGRCCWCWRQGGVASGDRDRQIVTHGEERTRRGTKEMILSSATTARRIDL